MGRIAHSPLRRARLPLDQGLMEATAGRAGRDIRMQRAAPPFPDAGPPVRARPAMQAPYTCCGWTYVIRTKHSEPTVQDWNFVKTAPGPARCAAPPPQVRGVSAPVPGDFPGGSARTEQRRKQRGARRLGSTRTARAGGARALPSAAGREGGEKSPHRLRAPAGRPGPCPGRSGWISGGEIRRSCPSHFPPLRPRQPRRTRPSPEQGHAQTRTRDPRAVPADGR